MSKGPPRIPPITRAEWTDEARDVFSVLEGAEGWENGPRYQVVSILAHHPALTRPFLSYNRHLLFHSILPDRAREIVTLYVAWSCKSEYEWLLEQGETEEAGALRQSIDRWVMAKADGRRVSAEKSGW